MLKESITHVCTCRVAAIIYHYTLINHIVHTQYVYFVTFYKYNVNTGSKEGNVSAVQHNPGISAELLDEINSWYTQGVTVDDVIERLRLRTVPPGYTIHSWVEGVALFLSEYVVNASYFRKG